MRRRSERDEKKVEKEPEIMGQTAVQHVVVTTKYNKEVPIDELNPVLPMGEEDEDDEDEVSQAATAEDDDPLAALLREMGASSTDWSLLVHRLVNYEKDYRYDPRAKMAFCGRIDLTVESLESLGYQEEIQRRWAREGKSNHFRLQIKRGNRIFGYLPVLSLEAADPEVVQKQALAEPPASPAQTAAPGLDFSAFIKQAKQFAELRELFAPGSSSAPATQPAPAAGALTTESALLHLVATDSGTIETVTDKIRGLLFRAENGARETGVIDLVLAAIQNDTLPKMIREAKSLLTEVQGAPAIAPAIPLPQQQPQTPPSSQLMQTTPEFTLLQFAVGSLAAQTPPAAAATWVIDFEEQNPRVTPYLNFFLQMAPADALTWLAQSVPEAAGVAQLPHATAWIEALQNELKKGEDDDEAAKNSAIGAGQ